MRDHLIGYSRLRYLPDPDTDWAWLAEAGYGEEPPPPVDYWAEGRDVAVYLGKYAARRVKRKVKAETTGRATKALRGARRTAGRAVNARARATGDAIRRRLGIEDADLPGHQAEPDLPEPDGPEPAEDEIDIPPYAAYRDALGMEKPRRGPRCLVCSDTGRITAPGVDIPCSECTPARSRKRRGAEAAAQGVRVERPGPGAGTGPLRPGPSLGDIRPRTSYRIDRTE